jgi:hypothetical protein
MDILRNLLGSVTSGIVRLLVTVGIIAAVGYFLVKPALETTEKIGREANQTLKQSFGDSRPGDISKQIENVNRRVQREVRRSFRAAKGEAGGAEKLLQCVQRANRDVVKIQRCTAKF